MTFLAPTLLALGAAAAVPLILHFFHRHQRPRMVFPALRYLRRAEREHAGRSRLRQLLLLALRILAIGLVAAAAARPFLAGSGSAHAPTAVVIILDNSMSSGAVVEGRRVLDDLKAVARQTLDAAAPDDAVWLLRAGEPWQPAVRGTAAEVARAVDSVRPSAGGSDLQRELARARGILLGVRRVPEIHLLSDLQATAFAAAGSADASSVPVRLFVPHHTPPANRAVTAVEVAGGLPPRTGQPSTVSATIVSAAAGDSVAVRLAVDGNVRAVTRAPTGASVVLSFPPRPTGLTTGHVEIDRDALAADDRGHFTAKVMVPPAVASTERLPFLEEALSVLAEAGRIRTTTADAAEVIVAPAGRGLDGILHGRSALVLPPGSPLQTAAVNRRLSDVGIAWRLDAPTGGVGRVDTAGRDLPGGLANARLDQVYGLTRLDDQPRDGREDSVLIRLRSGEPWAVTGQVDGGDGPGGRYVLLATPLTAEAGTLPTSSAMVPLLDRTLNAWTQGLSSRATYHPGDRVELPVADSVIRADGEVEQVGGGTDYRFTEAGIYRVVVDGEVTAAYAVNPPAAESDLAPLTAAEAAARIGGDVVAARREAWSDVVYHRRLGREIAGPFIALALAVLLAESVVAAAGRAA